MPDHKHDWQPGMQREQLELRARILNSIRAFFAVRDVLEVETPILSPAAITDPQLHSFKTRFRQQDYYLHTSPEFYMKRLLAAGVGNIFQLARVFRVDEQGPRHNPEFTLLEWYRTGFDHQRLMDEVEQLLGELLAKNLTAGRMSYQQAFEQSLGIDPLEASVESLQACARQHQIETPVGMASASKDEWLDWLMVAAVAPALPENHPTFIYDYPASQAALAKLNPDDPRVAHRFELYWGELELANGFYELTDAAEQRQRFEQENRRRLQQGLPEMPIDELLLDALEAGMPDCAGVAVGIDRLMMILQGSNHINEVISFPTGK